jgi:hypothetical protein
MKRVHCFLSLAVVGLFCAGCVPTHIISSPGASGIVIDRKTRQAVAGAQVAISRSWRRDWPEYGPPTLDEALQNTRPPIVVTGTNGHFLIPPERSWIMDFPPPEGTARGTLVVGRDGYNPAMVPLTETLRDGTVLLTPIGGHP